jgi:hypothetical protein
MKPTPDTVKLTVNIPAELAARFLPTENKTAVMKAALAAYFDNRDKK